MFRVVLIGLLLLLLLAAPALAQQTADPAFLQKALQALQAQRNAALDGQAAAEARAALLTEEVDKLRKQVEDLKPKAETK